MGTYIRKYISPTLLIVNLLVFMLFTLVTGYIELTHSFLNVLFFILLSAPLIALGTLLLIKRNGTKETSEYLYKRAFNILAVINTYLFVSTFKMSGILLTSVRAPIYIFYIIAFVLAFIVNVLELLLELGYLDKVIPVRDLSAITGSPDTKELADQAKLERLEAKTSSMRFFIALATILGVIVFIVPLFTEMFTVPLGGDYTQQQIPFYTNGYDDWWHFIKTGEFPLWDSNTFLGGSNIGSNSFYYSMNPFFFPILLFPRDLIPQGIAILMIGKFVLAAVTMRIYLKYLGVSEKESRFFAIVYAFCGWNIYYLWFNHFMEVAVVFPLIFLGIEKLLKEKKITLLILSLGLMGFANYFFLVTACMVGVIYAGFRYFQRLPKIEPSIIGLGILAFALGIMVSSVVLLPSLAISLNSDRVTNATYLDNIKAALDAKNYKLVWDYMTKWTQQYEGYDHKTFYPLISYYFPVLSNRSVALLNTSSYDNTISSLFSFSPVILLFIPAIYVSIKKRKTSHIIAIAFFLFALFTPFFYNLFHGFAKEYGRWQLFATFSLVTYVATSLPQIKEEKPAVLDLSLIINLLVMAFTVKVAFSYETKNGFSYMYEREYIIFYQFAMLFITYVFLRFMRNSKFETYGRSLLVFLEIAVMGTVTMYGHGFISYRNNVSGGLQSYNDDLEVIRKIQALDKSYYRIFNTRAYKGNDNLPMRENYNGLTTFHSLYNFELMEFNNWSRVNYNQNGWSLGIFERRGMLNDFLQIKYYVLNDNDHSISWVGGSKSFAPYRNVPSTYSYMDELSSDNRYVYKMNESFEVGFGVDYAFTYMAENSDGTYYDLIANQGRFAAVDSEEMYLNAALLNYEDARKVRNEYPHLATETYNTFDRNSYVRYTRSTGLNVTYYEMKNNVRYPYEAQIRGGSTLPTPEWVSENATVIPVNSVPNEIDGSKHVIEYTLTNGNNIIDEAGEMLLTIPLSYENRGTIYRNYNYNVFLYDENYELITFDNHLNLPSSSSYWKVLRSYHTPVPVKKITLVPRGGRVTPPYEDNVYVYPQTQLDNIRRTSLDNSLENVKVSTNKIEFSSNYADEKFVVTTIPFDPGWKVENAVGENLPVYKVQGGFVGFVSNAGEMDYVMSYAPENFNINLVLSISALLITLLLEVNVRYYKKQKRDRIKLEEALNNERI